MARTSQKQKLTDYDTQLLELAKQLDAERLEIVLRFAQDLLMISEEPESDFEYGDPGLSAHTLH
jgi:recombinational DNA repair ATPase RecF